MKENKIEKAKEIKVKSIDRGDNNLDRMENISKYERKKKEKWQYEKKEKEFNEKFIEKHRRVNMKQEKKAKKWETKESPEEERMK